MAMNPAVTATEDLMCGERQQPQRKPGSTLTVATSRLHQLPPHFLQKVSNFEQTAGEPTTETVCH
jgi:hypothetical protein